MKTITGIFCSLLLMGTLAFAADKPAEKKTCCEATVAAGLKCTNQCCVKAASQGKVCEKCHPKKADEKKK